MHYIIPHKYCQLGVLELCLHLGNPALAPDELSNLDPDTSDLPMQQDWIPAIVPQRNASLLIANPDLNASSVNWTGAVATLNVGYRFFTWTRRVTASEAGHISYVNPSKVAG